MALFAPSILPALDVVRGVRGLLGLSNYTVKVVTKTWTGARPGIGTPTTTTTQLFVGLSQNPRVLPISSNDVVASGGKYSAGDLRVGPLTPSYTGGGVADGTINPTAAAGVVESISYIVEGPGTAVGGDKYNRVADEMPGTPLARFIVLRKTGTT
ncbi:MAG: hypothetical protein NVS3B7_10140 [Candidatus Elarobacter sp.]